MPSWGIATDRGGRRTLVPQWGRWNRARKHLSRCFLASLAVGALVVAYKQGLFPMTSGIKDHLEVNRHAQLRESTLVAAEVLNGSVAENTTADTAEIKKEEPTKEEEKEEIEEDEEEKYDPLHDISRMDKHAVRLRWRDYPGECLIVYGNESGVGEFFWSIDSCAAAEDAWFRQRYNLPDPGEPGRITSEIGKVTGHGHDEYCLTVPNCVVGTPLEFRPCAKLNAHNTFTIRQHNNGAIQIMSDQCPPGTCVDVPDQNRTTGNIAQVWACSSHDLDTQSILKTDEVFSVGISKNDLKVFDDMELRIPHGPAHCQPQRVSKTLGKGLQHFEVHCSVAPHGPLSVTFENEKKTEQELDTYATIWMLWCSDTECECKGHEGGSKLMSISREERSLSCGVLMLSTHPEEGSCPRDLLNLKKELLKDGKVDCIQGKRAAQELQLHPLTRHRLDLRYLQAMIVGLRPQDMQAFKAFEVRNTSDSACEAKRESEDGAVMEVYKMKCPSGKEGKSLGIEVVEAGGEAGNSSAPPKLTEGAVVWSLWCLHDECTCEPVRLGKDQFSSHIKQGQKGCGVMMLNTHSKFGACPKPLKHLQNTIEEEDEEVDCRRGQEEAEKMAKNPELAKLIKLKWVKFGRHESAVTKVTKDALSIFSVVGGVVVAGTVPAWPAVAKFSQFMVMMASNHAELGLPDEFNDFAHKFTKFDELVKPLKKIKMPGLKDIGVNLNFVASSKWFLLKDKFVNQTMVAVLNVMKGSGMMSPGLVCFMEHYYDPVRRNLRDVTQVLEENGGEDTCDYTAEEEAGVLPKSLARRLEASEKVDETQLVAADGGLEAVQIREKWAAFQDGFGKQIGFMQKAMTYSKKEFGVTKNLLFCLLVLPFVIFVYVFIYMILSCAGSKWTYIPHLHPRFLLVFMADLILLNILMAWANVIWRRRLLQCENPFVLLNGMLQNWDGMSAAEPVTSFFMGIIYCFRPVISLLALIPPLHVGLADSQRVAMIIFILGPCLIFLTWLLHFLCSKIVRHPVSNHFQDEECTYIKSQQGVLGKSLHKVLFYEQPQVAPVEKVIAMDADGKAMYDGGKATAKLEDVSRCSLLATECKNFCCCCACCEEKKQKKAYAGTKMPLIALPESAAKKMSDANSEFDWVYRIKCSDVDFRGLPEQVTVAFNSDSQLDMGASEKPHVRLRIARGDQIISVAFQARSMDHPFPKLQELEPGATKEDHHKAMEQALAIELLQSTWRRLLVAKFEEMLKKGGYTNAKLGYLKWTMWDHKSGWTVAAFNLELLRPMHIRDEEFMTMSEKVKDVIFNTVKMHGTHLFQQGWAEARMLKRPRTDAHEMSYRPVKEGFLWMKIAEDSAKGMLTADQAAVAFPEVDANSTFLMQEGPAKRDKNTNPDDEDDDDEEEEEDKDEDNQEEDGEGGVSGQAGFKKQDEKEKIQELGHIDEKKVNKEVKEADEGFLSNISAATSFHDDRQQPLKDVEPIWYELDGKSLPALVLTSETFRAAKRNDLVEIFICGRNEEAQKEDGQQASDPLVKNGWSKVMKTASPAGQSPDAMPGIQFIHKKIEAWEDPREPFKELAVTRGKQDRKDENWIKAIKRFPDSYVGKVQVPIKMQGEFRADLNVKIHARDMLRLKDEVPMVVPFDHLQLAERDRWRVFYIGDHLKKKTEAPQLMKLINGLNLFFMVFAVVMIPKSIAEDPVKKAQEDQAWAKACPKDVADSEKCDPKQSEFQDMTEQIRRQINIAEGLSAAMLVLAIILILKVLINAYNDGDVKPRCSCCKTICAAIKSEFVHLIRIFRREKVEAVTVEDMNFSKLTGDINTVEAFSRAVKKAVVGAAAEEVTLETYPGSDTAIVYAQVSKDFPANTEVEATLGGQKKGRGSMIGGIMAEEVYNVKLKPVKGTEGRQIDKSDFGGCKPPEEGDGVSRMLANHAGDKQAGWFNSLKEAAKSVSEMVGEKMNQRKYVTYAWEVEGAKFSDLNTLGGHEGQLKSSLKAKGNKEVKSVELTCNSVQVNVIFPDKYKVDVNSVEKHLKSEADLRFAGKDVNKVKTTHHVTVKPSDIPANGRCPSWFGPAFVLGCLKFLLIVFLGLLSLANGATFMQFLFAIGAGLLLWLLSRLIFDSMVEGAVFRSSTMEVGQVGLILLPLCAQAELLEPITCSALMIIGVLWVLVTLCCKYLRDRIKKYEKEISKFINKHTKTLKVYTKKYKKWSDCAWFWDFLDWLKRMRLKVSHAARVQWHAFSANTRDPEWRWKVFFIICFLICCLLIAKLQHFALVELSKQVGDEGSTSKARAEFMKEAPGLALIFAFSLALLGLAYMVFMKWLPWAIEKCRDRDQWEKHLQIADTSSKAMWNNATEDEPLKEKITRDLVERTRAYGKEKPKPQTSRNGEGYAAMAASSTKRDSVLFDPLGIPVPMSYVPIIADDGGSLMEGSFIMLQNGNVPFKRLLCTEWAWQSPRYLVERTPLQVRLDTLARTGDGDVPVGSGDEPVPDAGVKIMSKKKETEVEVLVASIQVVNFTGLTLGKTDKNDGILSLWRTPDTAPEDDLVKWFEQVRRFFSDYGASFEKGSGVYAVLESLFYGVKDYGSDEGPAPGEIVQDHKRGYMATNNGMPYKNWVDRSMVDLVRRLGPERPDFPDLEMEEVSDDEQQFLDKGGDPEGGKNTPSTNESVNAKAPDAASQKAAPAAAAADKGGSLSIVIVGCTGLPPNPPGLRSCTISVKTPTPQNKVTASVFDPTTPKWDRTEQFTDFQPGTNVDFIIKGANEREVAKATDQTLTIKPGGDWSTQEIELIPDSALEKQPACGCFGPGGSQGKPKLTLKVAYNPKDPSPPTTPRKVPAKRSPAALGFPGGPLAWKLLYPPVTPQLLHVVVTAEDLRPTPSLPSPVPFGAPPALGMQGLEPPIRETRTLGREPGRQQDPEEDDRPPAKGRVPKAMTADSVDMKQATDKLDPASQASVREILARKNVLLDENRGTIKFSQRVSIDFVARTFNKDTPDAVYKNENKAKAGLKDAAELLNIYKTAKVVVEGHTNTKPKEMGDWSTSLAKNRAEKVVTSLVDMGVEGARLAAIGKPGKSGTNKQEIVLQVRSI